MKRVNSEVSYNTEKIFRFSNPLLKKIKKLAKKNKNQKFRICVHKSEKDLVQEMIVVHTSKTYVRPHKHLFKSESLYVIEGKATVIIFNQSGKILKFWEIGDIRSGLPFYYKMDKNIIHTFIFHSKYFVFKETTKGPFKKNHTFFPSWSPTNKKEGIKYIKNLKKIL